VSNPIAEILPNRTFTTLQRAGLLDEVVVRNIRIKRRFHDLRSDHGAYETLDILAAEENRSVSLIRQVVYTHTRLDILLARLEARDPFESRKRLRRLWPDPMQLMLPFNWKGKRK